MASSMGDAAITAWIQGGDNGGGGRGLAERGLFGFEHEAFHGDAGGAGAAAGAEVEEAGGFPDAALGGALEIEEERAGGVARLELDEGVVGGVDDDGQLVIEVMRGGGGHGAGTVGFGESFHIRIVAGEFRESGRREGLRQLESAGAFLRVDVNAGEKSGIC